MNTYTVRRLAEAFAYPKTKAEAMALVRRLATERPGTSVRLYTTVDKPGYAREETSVCYRADERGRVRVHK